jgi:hypothetical protein
MYLILYILEVFTFPLLKAKNSLLHYYNNIYLVLQALYLLIKLISKPLS